MRGRGRGLWIVLPFALACGGSSVSGTCAAAACLQKVQDLMFGCIASGSCVNQLDSTAVPIVEATCFDNGIKLFQTAEVNQGTTEFTSTNVIRVKKADTVCYTRTFVTHTSLAGDGGAGFTIEITTQDASGTTLATVNLDADNVATVTCPGGQPTVLTSSCGYSTFAINGAYLVDALPPTCTDGTCSF